MYQIKHVINYDKEALDRELQKDMERFYNDKRFPRLLSRGSRLRFTHALVSKLGLFCSLSGLVLFLIRESVPLPWILALSRILPLIGLALSSLSLFVLSSAVPKAQLASVEKLRDILDSFGCSPAMQYHMFLIRHGKDSLEIWGAETNDSKFEVTLSKNVDGHVEKDAFLCDFEEQNPDGVLVLDLRNARVLKQRIT